MDNISFPLKNLRSTADGKASILPMSEEENKFFNPNFDLSKASGKLQKDNKLNIFFH